MFQQLKKSILARLEKGLPICERPYLKMAEEIGCDEQYLMNFIQQQQNDQFIRRFGVIVQHRKMGYTANAMVVWDIKDEQIDAVGHLLAHQDVVTLCYQRPRVLPYWPYNLFTMIHGKNRDDVERKILSIRQKHHLQGPFDVLFSTRCFSQNGAKYFSSKLSMEVEFKHVK